MQQASAVTQDLVLVGGGHAHVHVLKSFAMRPVPGVRVTLIAREVETPYSGMLPGWVAGHYSFAECHIDLGRLARFAGARLIHDEAVGIDRARAQVLCRAHPPIRWDFLSLDIGSTPRAEDVPGAAEHAIAVKPIARFAPRWEALLVRARQLQRLRLAVVGGGAGGVELALAAQYRLSGLCRGPVEATLVTRGALLPSHNARVGRRFERIFAARGIAIAAGNPVVRVEPGALVCADGREIAFDEALWVTEAGAAPWLAATGLPLAEGGFVAIDEQLRSPGDARIFAAGDVATMPAHPRDKAGVFAVRQGPPLAANLRRALTAKPLRRAVPQKRGLALIGAGERRAVASRGPFTAEGAPLWRLKEWIDRRWMRRYRELPEMAGPGEEPMRCGGCAAKVPAAVLGRVIARLQPVAKEALAIGLDSPDDAAVIAFPGAPPLVQSVDFFRAMVADPYLFGQIAANHALGDIYAMGAEPDTALAIATLPPARAEIVEHDLFHMLRGALDVLEPAGAALAGGHSAEGAELALGFAVTGRVPRGGLLLRKGGLRAGDRLILTKPLGTGVILAADGRAQAPAQAVAAAVAAMLEPAAAAAACLAAHGASACTDVTGFGLLGHLLEMLRAAGLDAVLDPDAVPALDGAAELLARGITSSLHADNLAALAVLDEEGRAHPRAPLLIDPQTAGGLLAGIEAARAEHCLAELRRLGCRAAIIGRVEAAAAAASPLVRLAIGAAAPAREPAVVS